MESGCDKSTIQAYSSHTTDLTKDKEIDPIAENQQDG
jgi:hypothetical protein